MLVHPRLGPQIFLGEIITNIELEQDEPMKESCLDCGRWRSCLPDRRAEIGWLIRRHKMHQLSDYRDQ